MATERTPLLSNVPEENRFVEVNIRPSSDEIMKTPLVTIKQLFRFADKTDFILLTLATTGSILYGIITPAQFIFFGKMVNDFVEYIIHENYDVDASHLPDLEASTTRTALYYVLLAIGNLIFAWLGMALFAISAKRQVHKMRLALFKSAIYQNIGWFEMFSVGDLNTRFTEEMKRISDGMGTKLSRIVSSVVCFVAGYTIGFIFSWDLTLILLATFPLLVLCGIFMTKMTGFYTNKELISNERAGKIVEQSVSSIRTVVAFGGEHRQVKLYDDSLADTCKYAIRKAVSVGCGMAAFQIVLFVDYAVSICDEIMKTPLVTIKQLFRFADKTDFILLTLATTGSILYGIITPAQFIFFGKMVNDFVEYIIHENYDVDASHLPDLEASTTRTALYYVLLAIGNLIFAWLGMALFAISAKRQVHKMRLALFKSAIYQNIGWFEMFSVGDLNTRFTEEMKRISDGMGTKLSRIVSSVVCFVAGYTIGFIFSWDLTLILLATFPLLVLCGIFMTKMTGFTQIKN
ncbi:multidrug resistance protein 1B-like [Dendronephthya gigantea]|uniref:multidrug resistance protein 1B-like n=1 Tax=Dendronephthya gigantea TaxID=151771 RepID=UPI00106C5E1D|nr:multidrug resistance protein 1B-like [Dendronephthya gigantea]